MCCRVLLLGLLLFTAQSWAKPPAERPCATPQSAARQFVLNLEADGKPESAADCFSREAGFPKPKLIRLAQDLKAVLDARGFWVRLDSLPTEPDYVDSLGLARVPLVPNLPNLYLEKRNDRWVLSTESVLTIPTLYQDTFSGWLEGQVELLPEFLHQTVLGHALWQLMGLLILGLTFLGVSKLVAYLVKDWLLAFLTRRNLGHAGRVLRKAASPLGLLSGLGLVSLFLAELRLPPSSARVLAVGARVAAVVATVILSYRLVDLLVARLEAKAKTTVSRMDDQLVSLVRKVLRVVVVSAGFIFILKNLNIDVTSLLAGLGIGGLALALAAKDTAANLFGSLTLLVDAPFYVGDWIKSTGTEGIVTEIGLRSTRLRTFYDSEVSIPNSTLAVSNIDNMSRRAWRRYLTTIKLAYDTSPAQLDAFIEGIRALISAHPTTRKDVYEVHFVDFGEWSLDIVLQVFFHAQTWSEECQAKHRLLLDIKRLSEDLGVVFAFPTRTVQVEQVSKSPALPPDRERLRAEILARAPGGEKVNPSGTAITHGFLPGYDLPKEGA